MNWQDVLLAMLPEHVLLAGVVLLIVCELFSIKDRAALPLALLTVAAASGAALWLYATGYIGAPFAGQYGVNPTTDQAKALVLVLALPVLLIAPAEIAGYKFHVLLLFSLYGVALLLGALSFLTLFLGIELMSLPVYVLVLIARRRTDSAEAALKYLVLGGAASAMLLMGVTLLFGSSGSLAISTFGNALGSDGLMGRAGVMLVVVALFVKAAIVPFHTWAPDVYEGASVPVTAYMATIIKAAVLLATARLFGTAKIFEPLVTLLAILPLASIVWGNLAAMRQTSFRRMIAYSSIAHAGYLFYAFLGVRDGRFSSIVFYVAAYGTLSLLAFAALPEADDDAARDQLESLKGLFSRRPFAALMLAIAMLSLAGIPPLPGFTAKFFIFKNVIAAGHTAYAVAGFVGSYLGIFFYLRVIQFMFMSSSEAPTWAASRRVLATTATLLCLAATLMLSVLPGWLIERLI